MIYKLIWQGLLAVIVVGAGAIAWQAHAQDKSIAQVAQAFADTGDAGGKHHDDDDDE